MMRDTRHSLTTRSTQPGDMLDVCTRETTLDVRRARRVMLEVQHSTGDNRRETIETRHSMPDALDARRRRATLDITLYMRQSTLDAHTRSATYDDRRSAIDNQHAKLDVDAARDVRRPTCDARRAKRGARRSTSDVAARCATLETRSSTLNAQRSTLTA